MRELFSHIESVMRFATHRREREQADRVALGELARVPLSLPRGLELEWLGTAAYRLSYEGQSIFIDPYVTRVTLGRALRPGFVMPDTTLHERFLRPAGRVVGVLAGHTHFDHVLDLAPLVRENNCPAYGSASLTRLLGLYGLGDRAVEVAAHKRYEIGPFTVTFVPSLHSKLILGYAVPADGELTCEHLDALSPREYRCGQVYGIHIEVAGVSFYHQGSANLIDSEISHRGVDYFLAGIAGRRFTTRYWERILARLEPRTVVPNHFDDFFRPLGDRQGFSLNVNLAALPDEIAAVSRDFNVAAPEVLKPVVGS
jgi:L-ascorbate metabolism protein UlaG (beta-lactamase superfamily)